MSAYPKPEPPYTGTSDLYFATERQIRSRLCFGESDRGELTTTAPRQIIFRGMRCEVRCENVSSIALVRKAFPWVIVLAAYAAGAALIYFTSPGPFTWHRPAIYYAAAILAIGCIGVQWRQQWIEIVYSDDGGADSQKRAYFRRDGGFIVWRGPGRTRRLCQELRRTVLPDG